MAHKRRGHVEAAHKRRNELARCHTKRLRAVAYHIPQCHRIFQRPVRSRRAAAAAPHQALQPRAPVSGRAPARPHHIERVNIQEALQEVDVAVVPAAFGEQDGEVELFAGLAASHTPDDLKSTQA